MLTFIGMWCIILYLVIGIGIIEFIDKHKQFLVPEQNATHNFEKGVCVVIFPIVLIVFISIMTHQFLKKIVI